MEAIQNIIIIGSGNVANLLAPALKESELNILQVYSRNQEHALELANKVAAEPVSKIEKIADGADIYILCVSDSAISSILNQRNWKGKFLVHTAGSISINVFRQFTNRFGVLYPFQTFTKGEKINISEVPFFIEAGTNHDLIRLENFTKIISNYVVKSNSQQREKLHLAGVFANNFINYMFSIASQILEKENIPAVYLSQLLEETFRKAKEIGSFKAQTGPAVRNNQEIINKHLELLAQNPDWQKIYIFVSESIQKYYHPNG